MRKLLSWLWFVDRSAEPGAPEVEQPYLEALRMRAKGQTLAQVMNALIRSGVPREDAEFVVDKLPSPPPLAALLPHHARSFVPRRPGFDTRP